MIKKIPIWYHSPSHHPREEKVFRVSIKRCNTKYDRVKAEDDKASKQVKHLGK